MVTPMFTENIGSVYGNEVKHYAHRADVLRLKLLYEHGGIYLDLDMVALRSFDPLLHHDVVMSRELDGKIGGILACLCTVT